MHACALEASDRHAAQRHRWVRHVTHGLRDEERGARRLGRHEDKEAARRRTDAKRSARAGRGIMGGRDARISAGRVELPRDDGATASLHAHPWL